jgi:hypothetical protein
VEANNLFLGFCPGGEVVMSIQTEGRQPILGPTEDERDEKIYDPVLTVIGNQSQMKVVAHDGVNNLLDHLNKVQQVQIPLALVMIVCVIGCWYDYQKFGIATIACGLGLAGIALLPLIENTWYSIRGGQHAHRSHVQRILGSRRSRHYS